MRISRLASCLIALSLVACGHHGGDDGGGGDANGQFADLIKLVITPADQTLVTSNTTAATSSYTAMGAFMDGHTEDLTAQVEFGLDDTSLGSFASLGGAFTSATGKGGVTNVNAFAGAIEGSTSLTLQMKTSWNDPASTGLPADPGALFPGDGSSGTAPAAPTLVYPNDGVMVPPNLGKLELHFKPGAGNTVFELRFQNALLDIKVYLTCSTPMNGGCIYLPDPMLWSWLSSTARGGDSVQWSIRGTNAAGTAVGQSATMSLAFAPDDLSGGIYYWTNSAEAIMRWDFASTTQTMPDTFIGSNYVNQCIGCHALSHDGTKLVAETKGQNGGDSALVDVASKTELNMYGHGTKTNFESWNPDGTVYAAVWADNPDYDNTNNYNIKLLNGSDGTLMSTIDVGGTATHPSNHPDWSPDGTRIAFDQVGIFNTLQESYNDQIEMVARDGSGNWGTPTVLVARAAGINSYYPAFAPDGRLLVFDQSKCTSGNQGGECDQDTDPSATLYALDSTAGGTPVALANANKPGIADGSTTALTNSYPKWNPYISRKTNAGGHLAWITFSSTRGYGLRSPPSGDTWLWMAAIDLDAQGADPSFVPFALPFQDLTTSNHIAQWTTQVVGPIGRQLPAGPTATAISAPASRAR
jgi:hypothetical protein